MHKVYKIEGIPLSPVYIDLFTGSLIDCETWVKENYTSFPLFIVAI